MQPLPIAADVYKGDGDSTDGATKPPPPNKIRSTACGDHSPNINGTLRGLNSHSGDLPPPPPPASTKRGAAAGGRTNDYSTVVRSTGGRPLPNEPPALLSGNRNFPPPPPPSSSKPSPTQRPGLQNGPPPPPPQSSKPNVCHKSSVLNDDYPSRPLWTDISSRPLPSTPSSASTRTPFSQVPTKTGPPPPPPSTIGRSGGFNPTKALPSTPAVVPPSLPRRDQAAPPPPQRSNSSAPPPPLRSCAPPSPRIPSTPNGHGNAMPCMAPPPPPPNRPRSSVVHCSYSEGKQFNLRTLYITYLFQKYFVSVII